MFFSLLTSEFLKVRRMAYSPISRTYSAKHRRHSFKHLLSKQMKSIQIPEIPPVYTPYKGQFYSCSGKSQVFGSVHIITCCLAPCGCSQSFTWGLRQFSPGEAWILKSLGCQFLEAGIWFCSKILQSLSLSRSCQLTQ